MLLLAVEGTKYSTALGEGPDLSSAPVTNHENVERHSPMEAKVGRAEDSSRVVTLSAQHLTYTFPPYLVKWNSCRAVAFGLQSDLQL